MCAAFVAIPLYVVIVTSFKPMDEITLGEIFALPTSAGRSSPGGRRGTRSAPGSTCDGIKHGFFELAQDPLPEPGRSSIGISSVTGYALALWNVRWAGTFLFILFICAFVPFQIIMIPLIVVVAAIGHLRHRLGDRASCTPCWRCRC